MGNRDDGAFMKLNMGSDDLTILIPDNGSSGSSHRKFLRRWNQLSRLQRSLIYAASIIVLVILIVYINTDKTLGKKSDSKLIAKEPLINETLVIQSAGESSITIKKPNELDNKIDSKQHWQQFTGPTNEKMSAVVDAFKHAWRGYKKHAWGHDNLKPLSKAYHEWFSLGLTIVDSLDTAFIMGLHEEFQEGRDWIDKELVFTRNKDVNLFEVTIRVLGSLLTNYHFSQDDMFLKKAEDLGERLLGAFSSSSGIPYSDVNLATKTAHAAEWSHSSTTSEVTTVQLEFRELSRLTNNNMFEQVASAVSKRIHDLPKKHGLVPIYINPTTGQFQRTSTITLGARGDSYYEYLLKQWLQTGKTINYLIDDYMMAIEGVRDLLAKRSSPNKYLFIGELNGGVESFNPKMDHLVCFLPGTLALGHAHGMPDWHMTMAEDLMQTCYRTYTIHPTFLAPEITHFNMASSTEDMYTKPADAHNLLRPEFVESLWYMYQITGNVTYQQWGWLIFNAFEKHAKVEDGYTSLNNVKSENPARRDMMETFFLAETLKYFYLLFSEDRYLIDLRKFVINSEAHALPIRDY